MAQITQLQSTNTLGTDDQAILRQGTIDRRISLELAGTLSWAKRNGFNHVGSHIQGLSFSSTEDFSTFQGKVYFVKGTVSLPYTSTTTDPSMDNNLNVKDEGSLKSEIYKPNHLRNHNFTEKVVDVVVDATPQNFNAGDDVFSSWKALTPIVGGTFINNEWSRVSGSLYQDIQREGTPIEQITAFTASIKSVNGISTQTGVSWSIVGDSYRIVVDASNVFSVCFNEGNFAASHSVDSLFDIYGDPSVTGRVNVKAFGAKGMPADDTQAFLAAIVEARKTSSVIYAPTGKYLVNSRLFFGMVDEEDSAHWPYINICRGLVGDGEASTFIYFGTGVNGDVCLDYSGMREKVLKDVWVQTTNNSTPLCGILTARLNRPSYGATNNDWGEFVNCHLYGKFSLATYLAASEEESWVHKVRMYNEHPAAEACFISTDNLLVSAPTITPSPLTNLAFTTGSQSNLHQVHSKCDYNLATVSSTGSNPAMIKIRGSLMVDIKDPFFNNNSTNYDCVRVEGGDSGPHVYGINITNPNCHEVTKSGLRLVGDNINCSWVNGNSTHGFDDGEIVIEAFTNSFNADCTYPVIQRNYIRNSTIVCMNDFVHNSDFSIENTKILLGGAFIEEGSGANSSANSFSILKNGQEKIVRGRVPSDLSDFTSSSVEINTATTSKSLALKSTSPFMTDPVMSVDRPSDAVNNNYYIDGNTGGVKTFAIEERGYRLTNSAFYDLGVLDIQGNSSKTITLSKLVSANMNLIAVKDSNAANNSARSYLLSNRYGSNDNATLVSESSTGSSLSDVSVSTSVNANFELEVNITTTTSESYKVTLSVCGVLWNGSL